MNNVGEIDLNQCNYKKCFWITTKESFENFTNEKYILRYKKLVFRLKMVKTNDNRIINCNLRNPNFDLCMEFSIIKSDMGVYLHLSNLTNNCSSYFKNYTNINGTRFILELLDNLALMYGAYRIFLQDAATPFIYKKLKLKYDLDFTILNVMKEEKTFYEKYGYNICYPDSIEYPIQKINLDLQKKLLKNFRFDLFKLFLDENDSLIINKILKNNKKNYTILGEFYVDTIAHLTKLIFNTDLDKSTQKYTEYIDKLQEIITNENYPWSGFVSNIQSEKYCMEKFI